MIYVVRLLERNENLSRMSEKNLYYRCMKTTFFLLKAILIFPFELQEEQRRPILKTIISKIMAIAASCAFLLVIYWNTRILLEIGLYTLKMSFYEDFILNAHIITNRALQVFILSVCWRKKKVLSQHIRNWRTFQENFETLTREKFAIPNERQFVIYPTLYILFTAVMVIALVYSLNLRDPSDIYVRAYLTTLSHSIALYRYMNGLFQNIVAQKIHDGVKNSIEKFNCEQLKQYVHLWRQLCYLIDEYVAGQRSIFMLHMIVCITWIIIAVYMAVGLTEKSGILERWPVVGIITFVVITQSVILAYYCEIAYTLREKLTTKLIRSILKADLIHMDSTLLNEVWKFLQNIKVKNQKVNLNGSSDFNRSSLITMMAFTFTYVFLLRQFEYAARKSGIKLN